MNACVVCGYEHLLRSGRALRRELAMSVVLTVLGFALGLLLLVYLSRCRP